jgi:hypothetical protein
MNQIIVDRSQTPVLVDVVTEGPQGPAGGIIQGRYGSFLDTTTQFITAPETATRVNIGTTVLSKDIRLVNNQIIFDVPGVYSLTFSVQLQNFENNVIHTAGLWLRFMGQDYPNSATAIDVPALRQQKPGETVCTVNLIGESLNPGDYVELFWGADSTQVRIATIAANGYKPAAPGVILTVSQVG